MKTELRLASEKRQVEWGSTGLSLAFRGLELLGEVGEAANVMKKLERERLDIKGSRSTVEALAEELADVVICADLIGLDVDRHIEIGPSDHPVFVDLTFDEQGVMLGHLVGRVCLGVTIVDYKKSRSTKTAINDLVYALRNVITMAWRIADEVKIDLDSAIRNKFNATSEKQGLLTKIVLSDRDQALRSQFETEGKGAR